MEKLNFIIIELKHYPVYKNLKILNFNSEDRIEKSGASF